MSRPDVDDFQRVIDEYWHGRPPTTLEDVMTMYGVLTLADDPGLFNTPAELSPFVDDGRLVTVHIDLTGEQPAHTDVTVDTLREDDLPRLGYTAKESGRGADYSLTQAGSNTGNPPEGVADTLLSRFRLWCHYDSVQTVADAVADGGHPDGWVVEKLVEPKWISVQEDERDYDLL